MRCATASVELDTVHRFRARDCAALTLRLREPRDRDDAIAIARQSPERGHVTVYPARRRRGPRWSWTISIGMRVGPDVDAAGLYVGLTRGRHHNLAITVPRNDEEATAQVAETMMRATTELTIQDAMRAAHAELRREAREREARASASWVTPNASPSRGGPARWSLL